MNKILAKVKCVLVKWRGNRTRSTLRCYYRRYKKYGFRDGKCKTQGQFEASITRLYHTVEKGLAHSDYRAGFGKENVEMLILSMNQYAMQFDVNVFFYETALSVLESYVQKNREYGLEDITLNKKISNLHGNGNQKGGTVCVERQQAAKTQKMNYEQLMKSRHSVREFGDGSVCIKAIEAALEIAQYTPSACNRQGWNAYVVTDKKRMSEVLNNQNGNRGFGKKIDKLLVLTFDLSYSNRNREVFQGFIDGGMYAANVLNALWFEGVATIPLSASLKQEQERNIRKVLGIRESEVFVLFVGVGEFPEATLTTKSTRRPPRYTIV